MKSLIPYLAILFCIFSLNGCNTFSGIGKDLQAGGKAITNAANDASSSTTKKTSNNQTIGTQVTTTKTTSVTTTTQ